MAILTGGINGGFSGKAGSYVGYYQHGKWVIRGLPKLSRKNKKGTKKQNLCRSKFKRMQYFLGPILSFIRIGFNLEGKKNGNTAHNSAKSWNMLNGFDDNGELNYPAIRVSSGYLEGAADANVEGNDHELIFTWRDNSDYEGDFSQKTRLRSMDQVMLLAYDVKHNQVYSIFSGARRKACREVLEINTPLANQEFHTWISFIADNRESISQSIYTGKITY